MDILEIQPRFKDFLSELCNKQFTHYALDTNNIHLYNVNNLDVVYIDSISIHKVLKFIITNLD